LLLTPIFFVVFGSTKVKKTPNIDIVMHVLVAGEVLDHRVCSAARISVTNFYGSVSIYFCDVVIEF
jgi:hypothetical protein